MNSRIKHHIRPHDQFNRWTVLNEVEGEEPWRVIRCRCECGFVSNIRLQSLLDGRSKSCGCANRGRRKDGSRNTTPLILWWD